MPKRRLWGKKAHAKWRRGDELANFSAFIEMGDKLHQGRVL
jgi:hypothetical protein